MTHIGPPDRHEAAEYYYTYIDQVPAGDIRQVLSTQLNDVVAVLGAIPDEKSRHRYSPDKWTIRQLTSHLNDTERVFSFRAFWFARGYETPMPSFDQDVAIALAGADERPWQSHIDEFRAVRSATIRLFENLPEAAWSRRGIASENPVTVRALAYITAGHVAHHLKILRDRYLQS